MDFTRGRIDQTHQGSVSIIKILLILTLTMIPMTSYDAGINTFDTANVG